MFQEAAGFFRSAQPRSPCRTPLSLAPAPAAFAAARRAVFGAALSGPRLARLLASRIALAGPREFQVYLEPAQVHARQLDLVNRDKLPEGFVGPYEYSSNVLAKIRARIVCEPWYGLAEPKDPDSDEYVIAKKLQDLMKTWNTTLILSIGTSNTSTASCA